MFYGVSKGFKGFQGVSRGFKRLLRGFKEAEKDERAAIYVLLDG